MTAMSHPSGAGPAEADAGAESVGFVENAAANNEIGAADAERVADLQGQPVEQYVVDLGPAGLARAGEGVGGRSGWRELRLPERRPVGADRLHIGERRVAGRIAGHRAHRGDVVEPAARSEPRALLRA